MAVEQFVTLIHSALVSWTMFLYIILFMVKIVQMFTGPGALGHTGRTPGDTRDPSRRTREGEEERSGGGRSSTAPMPDQVQEFNGTMVAE
ncbi:hypothetical protein JW711_02200 [Candidatus Woesearchaeota archaeon]|nr:hypothetical protein [Candidatus Woesearchaeota archaeon]